MNIIFLFFSSLFPFIAAFIGDYPTNSFVVAIYPVNMLLAGLTLRWLWKYAFIDTDLAPNTLSSEMKRKVLLQHEVSALINLLLAFAAFIWTPLTVIAMMIMPAMFIMPEMMRKE